MLVRAPHTALLTRILEQPDLVEAVRALPARSLQRIVQHVGLEDAGEIVALATTEQLEAVFDEDLWRSDSAGEDESFDGARFALWLEVLLEAGDEFVADRLAELPEELLALAVHRLALVVNLDDLAVEASGREEPDDAFDKAFESALSEEIDEYRLLARRHDGWDALIAALLALDARHHDVLARVLARCCAAASEYAEDNGGLYAVLTSDEMLEGDVAGDREDRRARDGYVAPSAARAFLGLADRDDARSALAGGRDAVTKAYFRDLRPRAPAAVDRRGEELLALLGEAEIEGRRPRAPRLGAGASPFQRAMTELAGVDPVAHAARMEELAYLANVLIAGESHAGRRYRPVEAGEAVVAACSEGLARAAVGRDAVATLRAYGADQLFRLGRARR